MHGRLFVVGCSLLLAWLFLAPLVAHAAAFSGCVVDSAGQPVAGAEVRVWQRLPGPPGVRVSDQEVKFADGEVLLTDADGRFATPDVLVGEAFAFVIAEAAGTLPGRSGWIEVGKEAAVMSPDIVLKRLRAVTGQVLDRQGRPVAGATVCNSGDGRERVETKTGRNGKFFLDGVPEGQVFLFAEKTGYRFKGTRLPAGESVAACTLTSLDETAEPLTTLPPLMSAEEETALARAVLNPWLEDVIRSGDEMRKLTAVGALSHIDPLAAVGQYDALNMRNQQRTISRHGLVALAVEHRPQLPADEIRNLIEPGDDEFWKAYEYVTAARQLDGNQQPRQLEWLEAALAHTQRIDDSSLKSRSLAEVAKLLFSMGDRERASTILAQAEKAAEIIILEPDQRLALTFAALALANVNNDTDRACEHLEQIKDFYTYQRFGGLTALKLLPERPDDAVALWRRTVERRQLEPRPPTTYWFRYTDLADFCYRLAQVDRSRAEEVARTTEDAVLQLHGKAAIALALADKQPAEARKLLESLVRDDLPRMTPDKAAWRRLSPATTAAWLLPIAERVAPDLCQEIFWRSLALRLPRPLDDFDGESEATHIELVKMLARYDRDLARRLLEPLATRTAQVTSAAASELGSPHARAVVQFASQWARDLIVAAVHVDARWAKELLAAVPDNAGGSGFGAVDGARQAFVWTLSLHGPDRWPEGNVFGAGFWQPRSDKELDR